MKLSRTDGQRLSHHAVKFVSWQHPALFVRNLLCKGCKAVNHNVSMLVVCLCVRCSYVYIPLLPAGLLEVLNTPTPFIAGVHTSLKPDLSDLVCLIVYWLLDTVFLCHVSLCCFLYPLVGVICSVLPIVHASCMIVFESVPSVIYIII